MLDCDHIFTFKDDAGRIGGSIYQGSMPDSDWIESFDVLVLAAWENNDPSFYANVRTIVAPGEDVRDWPVDADDIDRWREAAKDVALHVRNGREVLVTCMAGLNRSSMITAMALHNLMGWDGEECVRWVQERRPGALFNPSFKRWLEENIE